MGTNGTETKSNWLQLGTERAKKRANSSATVKPIPWWEVENPAANDGIYYDKINKTWEVRQYGKPPLPLSGRQFYNKITGMIEVYEDLSKPPVLSFKRD